MVEQEWLLLGRPLRHVIGATDGTPAPLVAPDPRWMALHKLWLSQKPRRAALKRPKDQAQGLLLLRAVIEAMPAYPVDDAFLAAVPAELKGFLRIGIDWALAHRSPPLAGETGDEFARVKAAKLAPRVLRKIRRLAAALPEFPSNHD